MIAQPFWRQLRAARPNEWLAGNLPGPFCREECYVLSQEQVARYQRDGFILGERVLSEAEVSELQEEVLRVIRNRDNKAVPQPVMCGNMGKAQSPVWQIVNIHAASAAFRRLLNHPAVVEAAAQLTAARELRIWHDQIQYKPAGVGGVNMWHQDGPYWPILEPKDAQVTAWIALDDAAEDNGCMSMVPGSHLWGNAIDYLHEVFERPAGNPPAPAPDFSALPPTYRGHTVEVRLCPVPKGSVHFHHSLTWHGSHGNTSGRPRRAIALHLMTEATRYHAAGGHPMKPYVTVADGAKLEGAAFPLVWSAGRVAAT
jgi:ectoine hydroxylase-related dioxygenase (phytanoyl-CoA dioxygenase family)